MQKGEVCAYCTADRPEARATVMVTMLLSTVPSVDFKCAAAAAGPSSR